MAKYILGYHGGTGAATTEEEVAAVMAKWGAWFGQLGEAVVDGGAPTAQAATVQANGSVSDGAGANPLTGYSIVTAGSFEEATSIAKGCPHLEAGGTIEVAELMEM
jgi:hypothetical protein